MLLNATHVTAEYESYPNAPQSDAPRPGFPAGFPMPPTQEADPLGDPLNSDRDADALKNITPHQIIAAYHWMGAQRLNGRGEGNDNWIPCVGGEFNQLTGHWRERDENNNHRLLSIFEIAAREERFITVHDARLKLFDQEARNAVKSQMSRFGGSEESAPETHRVTLECGEDALPTRVHGGDYPTEEAAEKAKANVESTTHYKAKVEKLSDGSQDYAPPKNQITQEQFDRNCRLSKIRAARMLLEEAQKRLHTVRTPFGFCQALAELDMAVSNLADELDMIDLMEVGEILAEKAKEISSEIPEPPVADSEAKTAEPPAEPFLESVVEDQPAETDPINPTIEELGIAKGTCNLLRKAGVETYKDILINIDNGVDGIKEDWSLLTELPGIGKAKVESIRGACEKFGEGLPGKKPEPSGEGSS